MLICQNTKYTAKLYKQNCSNTFLSVLGIALRWYYSGWQLVVLFAPDHCEINLLNSFVTHPP